MNKKISIFIFIISLATLFAVSANIYSKYKPYSDINKAKIGKNLAPQISATPAEKIMAPDFRAKDINGKDVSLTDYKGKIIILNFWTTWCKYCKVEMPDLNEVNKELDKYNAVLLAIDVEEDSAIVKDYLSKNNINLKVLLDSDGSISKSYNVSGFPTTYFINSDLSLYTYIPGQTDKSTIIQILNEIRGVNK